MFNFYIEYEYWFAATQLALAMLGMGATLQLRDFLNVFTVPASLLGGLFVQMLLVPVIAWLFLIMLEPAAGLAIGLALCAAIPGGTMSNVFTFLARGNAPLSIALTVVTTLACLVTTPLVLGLLIAEHMPADFVMPAAQIATEIALILLLPLVLGMIFLALLPQYADRFSRNCIRGSVFIILLIVIGATGAGRADPEIFGMNNLLILTGFVLALALTSWLVPLMLGRSNPDSTAINIEVTVRNGNLGLLIKASMFPAVVGVVDPVGDIILMTVLLYGGLAIPLGFLQVYLHGKINRRLTQQQAATAG